MKFTKEQIKQIIKEEIEKYVFEQDPFPSVTLDNPEAMEDEDQDPVGSMSLEPEEFDAHDWEGELAQLVLPAEQAMARAFAQKRVRPSVNSPQLKKLKNFLKVTPVPRDSNRYEEFIKDKEAFRASVVDSVLRGTEARIRLALDRGGESMAALLDPEEVRQTNKKLELPELRRELSRMENALRSKSLTTTQKNRLKDSIQIYRNAVQRELSKVYDKAPKKRMPGKKTVDPTVLLTPGVEVPGI
tara:strand:+ start:287 stop:1015 length:729 start_codon:yes stop_codon:yes gene_type:complete